MAQPGGAAGTGDTAGSGGADGLPPSATATPTLRGRAVALTRDPERSGSMLASLQSVGAEVLLLPVIDFETPAASAELDELDGAVRRLSGGGFDWLVVTSATTVRALERRAVELGVRMDRLVPPGTRVAAVGPTTQRALEGGGIGVDHLPAGEYSAAGLLESWPDVRASKPVSVLLPQADIADPALRDGLRSLGADVVAVTAYRTVDYPADPRHRLIPRQPGQNPGMAEVLSLPEFARRQADGGLDAVVLTSPSAARRVSQACGRLNRSLKVVTIGRPTAEQARSCGLSVAAVAPEPTPEGIVDALEQAFMPGTPA